MKSVAANVKADKLVYTPPRLIKYGDVGSLTQSGGSGSHESSMGQGPFMASSERRLKERVVKVGTHPLGVGIYLFDYRPEYRATWGEGRQFGMMADEVEGVMPEAVSTHPDGYRLVNYAMLGVRRFIH